MCCTEGGHVKSQALWKTAEQSLTKLSAHLLYDPAILLGIYHGTWKHYVHTNTCIKMFMSALFAVAQSWKLLKCPPIGKRINKLGEKNTLLTYPMWKISKSLYWAKDAIKGGTYFQLIFSDYSIYIELFHLYRILKKQNNVKDRKQIHICLRRGQRKDRSRGNSQREWKC